VRRNRSAAGRWSVGSPTSPGGLRRTQALFDTWRLQAFFSTDFEVADNLAADKT
jgi:hypothetical protein